MCSLLSRSDHRPLKRTLSPVLVQHAWDIDALNMNCSGLTAYAYPPMALIHRAIHVRQYNCLIIVMTPGWLWFWDLVQLSTEIPLQLPVSTTSLIQAHNYVFHSNPKHLNLCTWSLGVAGSRDGAVSMEVKERITAPQRSSTRIIYRSSGPFSRNGAEKFGGFPHFLCETSLRFFHVPVPGSKQAPFDH